MEEPKHLLDLIWRVKPKAALFTTYTFSVSHFDAVFLPVLRSVGCHDISVLVDADEAASGTEESHSRAAGRVYRVAPVVPPGGGCFHPKLAYLAAEADDVLAVASGNLTASGQSLQLESFDCVAARAVPSVFGELADWMQQLALQVKETSPQASRLLAQTAPRASQVYRRSAAAAAGGHIIPPPTLVHTLGRTARESLEALFIDEAGVAETLTVLSPFHAPDGGPVLRLAAAVGAKTLAVGVDGGRNHLTAPFEQGRFKPHLPGRFVIADTDRNNKRLHAKVFEIQAADKVLVMTGSVNATVQSLESRKNIEVSLARWLPRSPFAWKEVHPEAFEVTQDASDFVSRRALYVDGWLAADRTLHGWVVAPAGAPASLRVVVLSADIEVFKAEVAVDADGSFSSGPVPAFDTSRSCMLKATAGQHTASCWLSIHDELDIASEERERRAAIARVLRGEYAAEDIAEVVRLLSTAAQAMATGVEQPLKRPPAPTETEALVEFSFMRWEASGRLRGGNTFLGRNPYELLRALNRWMNADLSAPTPSEHTGAAPRGAKHAVQLQGGTDGGRSSSGPLADPYALLDQLCQTIPVALERQPGLEHSGVLAEVVASRAVDRALKQDLKMAPCLSWLDRFSRFTYPDEARKSLGAVAAGMACVTAYRLLQQGHDPQLSVLREAIERLAGHPVDAANMATLVSEGLGHELYRRVSDTERDAVLAMSSRLAKAATLDDTLIALLRKALSVPRHLLAKEPEAEAFPEVLAAWREHRHTKVDLIRGLLDQQALARKGCPICYHELNPQQVATLRQRHVLFHKNLRCNQLLLFSDQAARMEQRLRELPGA